MNDNRRDLFENITAMSTFYENRIFTSKERGMKKCIEKI